MIKIPALRGLVPKTDGYNAIGQATIARDIDFSDGYAKPWCCPEQIADAGDNLSAHIKDGRVRFADKDVRFFNDELGKLVYSSTPCDCPRVYKDWCSDDDPIALGLPIPFEPTLTSNSNSPVDDLTELVSVVIRYCNEACPGCPEGPRSEPSAQIKCNKDDILNIELPPLPTDKYEITHVKVFLLKSTWDVSQGMHDPGTDGFVGNNLFGGFETAVSAQYFEAASYPVSASGTTISITCEMPKGRALMCADNFPPPDGMCIAGETTRGSLVGFKDTSLLFSQRNMYHGWPQHGIMTFGDDIDAVCVWGDTVFVLTCCGDLYVVLDDVTGAEVSECRTTRLVRKTRRTAGKKMLNHKQVVCDHTGFTWISDEGIMRASLDGNVVNLTWPWFGYSEWLNTLPSKMTLGSYRGSLMFSSPAYSGVLDLNSRGEIVSQDFVPNHSTLSICPDCWISDCDGRLYFISCGILWEFNAGNKFMEMRYRSAVISAYGTYSTGLVEFFDTAKSQLVGKNTTFVLNTYFKGQNCIDSVACTQGSCCFRIRRRKAQDVQLGFTGCEPVRALAAGASQSGIQSLA